MPDTETSDGDALEQRQDPSDPASAVSSDVPEMAIEVAEADAVEQQTDVRGDEAAAARGETSWDADEGDLAESAREVPYGDEDYR